MLRRVANWAQGPLVRPIILPALIGLAVVALGGAYVERQSRVFAFQSARAEVLNEIGLVKARLEGNMAADVELLRGLAATIAANPDINQDELNRFADHLLTDHSEIKSIALAPDMVVRMVYPYAANSAVIGLNYLSHPAQREAAKRARDSGKLVVAGPLQLVQGGIGLVARYPIYIKEQGAKPHFWGLVAAVIDVDKLYRDSELGSDAGLDIALTGRDGTGADGPLFYGSPKVSGNDPVAANVHLPGDGIWQIAAVPKAGWPTSAPNAWAIHLATLLAGLLVVGPTAVAWGLLGERFRNRTKLMEMSRRLRLALRASAIGVWELDVKRNKLFWDRRMRQLYGAPSSGPIDYRTWGGALHPDDRDRAQHEFDAALAGTRPYSSRFRIILPDGEIRHIRSMGTLEQGRESKKIIGVNWDITEDVVRNLQFEQAKMVSEARADELEKANKRIEQLALEDPLTGLPNRRFLDDLLEKENKARIKTISALLHVDLDRFKQINDTMGHAAGDAILVHTAKTLRNSLRQSDVVARVGGDEFVILCHGEIDREGLERMAQRIVETLRAPFVFNGRPSRSGASIGIATADTAPKDARQLLVNADIALYRAKNEGRNTFQFFSEDLQKSVVVGKQMADEILTGLEEKQFVAYYQGQFDAVTNAIVGVEALVRWRHPRRGILGPGAFMGVADEISVLPMIDQIILEQSLKQMKTWERAGVVVPKIAVNVSARRLADPELIAGLAKLDFKPGTLTFELVESTFLDQRNDQVNFNLDQLHDMGIDIEIDDFGTGYASIVSLMRLKPKRLKIDRQLVQPILHSASQRKLVRSIVEIGRSLGIESTAEGIESTAQGRILTRLGCTTLQGFALAKPMSGRSFTRFAKAHQQELDKQNERDVA